MHSLPSQNLQTPVQWSKQTQLADLLSSIFNALGSPLGWEISCGRTYEDQARCSRG